MKPDIKIPGYQIKYMLGRGGMASVYLAIQESFGREVALKILAPDHADETFSERFLREARIVSRLIHPNIVTVYDVGIHEGYHYLSMEFIPGQDLKHACESLSRKQLLDVIKEVAKALNYAGEKGYVHRDVKPENIMLHKDGRVILMDFGIARGNDTTRGMTQTGKAIGTPHYMSPEQAKGLSVDRRSDIYSIGIVLYQLLAGYVPYDAPSAVAVCIKHISDPIPILPAGLEIFQPVINTCLSKHPDHRYQTAGELIQALDTITDAQLAAINSKPSAAKPGAAKPATPAHNAETVIANASPKKAAKRASSPPQATAITVTHDFKRLRRRRTLILLFLLVITGGAGYLNQHKLMPLWHAWQQRMDNTATTPALQTATTETPYPDATVATPPKAAHTEQTAPPTPVVEAITPAGTAEHIRDQAETTIEAEQTVALTPRERIQQLRRTLDDNPQNAIELAGLYRHMLKQNPDNPQARKAIIDLRGWYMRTIRSAFEANDTQRARQLVDMLKDSFPRAGENEKLRQIEQRLVRAERLQKHLQNAHVYFNANAFTQPAGANALQELHAALKIDPEHKETKQFIREIADTYYAKAKTQHVAGKPDKALALVDLGLQTVNNHKPLLSLRDELQTGIQKQKHLTNLLAQAEKQLKTEQLIQPKGQSAYDLFQAVLLEQPSNTKAISGLDKIEQRLVKRIKTAIDGVKLEQAESMLKSAQQHYGKTPAMIHIQQQLAQAIEATLPKITQVIFADTNLTTLEDAQSDKLQPGRTLYVGFKYDNFDPATSLLQADLLDGAGRIQIAQKPVIVIGSSGEHFFDIELPVEGFKNGSYNLDLLLGNKRLIRASFLVDNLVQP